VVAGASPLVRFPMNRALQASLDVEKCLLLPRHRLGMYDFIELDSLTPIVLRTGSDCSYMRWRNSGMLTDGRLVYSNFEERTPEVFGEMQERFKFRVQYLPWYLPVSFRTTRTGLGPYPSTICQPSALSLPSAD